jgi:polyhydroxyalkanoate synthase
MDTNNSNTKKGLKEFNIGELFNGIAKINQRVFQNNIKNYSGYYHDNRDIGLTYSSFFSKLFAEPTEMVKVQGFQMEFLQKQMALWQHIFINPYIGKNKNEKEPFISPKKADNRFKAPHWNKYPFFDFLKQNHLLIEQFALRIVDEVEMGESTKGRLDFYTKQYAELFSPANFLFTNPEVLELAVETKGDSLWKGFNNFVNDIEKGRITQVDESAFEVGKNLATTPGEVIYENELIQLIQYAPTTKNVQEIPLLIIPPWINKFYVLDLTPEESFVKFMVDQGFTVFIISWKNPTSGMGYLTFDDYVNKGALKAIEVAENISVAKKINVLGYCLGGTLLGVAASILASQKKEVINTITFLASMLDFSDIGPMGDEINEALVNKLERGELLKDGIMHGHDMERAFNLIRVKDLVWNYAIDNYLKGMPPSVFDVMYWTNDNTNLPASMYVYYMKEMILKNKLVQKNALNICGTLIDIGKIEAPVFIVAMKRDYISPPQTVFITTQLVSGPVEFILGESGHVMGAVNPPIKKKYGYYLDGKLGKGFDEWQNTAQFHEGSWWTTWSGKLKDKSGKQVPASKFLGNKNYVEIEPAPGRYVKERCETNFPNSTIIKKEEKSSTGNAEKIMDIKTQKEEIIKENIS